MRKKPRSQQEAIKFGITQKEFAILAYLWHSLDLLENQYSSLLKDKAQLRSSVKSFDHERTTLTLPRFLSPQDIRVRHPRYEHFQEILTQNIQSFSVENRHSNPHLTKKTGAPDKIPIEMFVRLIIYVLYGLGEISEEDPCISSIGKVSYRIYSCDPWFYLCIGEALTLTFLETIGRRKFTEETERLWLRFYNSIANKIAVYCQIPAHHRIDSEQLISSIASLCCGDQKMDYVKCETYSLNCETSEETFDEIEEDESYDLYNCLLI